MGGADFFFDSGSNRYQKTRHMDELLDAVLEQFVRATFL